MIINPRHADRLVDLGLTTVADLLDLSGEVVSGHPDRHVVRVELPGWSRALYLKREHRVGWRVRLRNWRDGFGWVSRCEREAAVLRQLEAAGHKTPEWVAYGEAGGRAFLLVEEVAEAVDLRRVVETSPQREQGRTDAQGRTGALARAAGLLGETVARLHADGFTTPDLTAKHVFVHPETFAVTLIDWQSTCRVRPIRLRDRVAALAALHASLPDGVNRLRFLWAYRRAARARGADLPRFSVFARQIEAEAERIGGRRSIRDQRQPASMSPDQRLMWLAGEAVCAVPDVAAVWPVPAVSPPFYNTGSRAAFERMAITLPDGRPAVLLRGRCVAPFGRLRAWVRGKPWRSPGATLGRVLFHLPRYGIPAPRLLAFGQRLTGPATAEWFALHEPPTGDPVRGPAVLPLLRKLHDAGCRVTSPAAFRVDRGTVSVGDPTAVCMVRRVSARARRADERALTREGS